MKLGHQCNYHKGKQLWIYANQSARLLWPFHWRHNFISMPIQHSVLNLKAQVGTFNLETFSVSVKSSRRLVAISRSCANLIVMVAHIPRWHLLSVSGWLFVCCSWPAAPDLFPASSATSDSSSSAHCYCSPCHGSLLSQLCCSLNFTLTQQRSHS